MALVIFAIGVLSIAFPRTGGAAWFNADIGAVGQAGSTTQNNGTFTVMGAGSGATGVADSLQFVYQVRATDFEIIVKVESLSSGNPYTATGLMLRESLLPESPNVFLSVSAQDGINMSNRTAQGFHRRRQHTGRIPGILSWQPLAHRHSDERGNH